MNNPHYKYIMQWNKEYAINCGSDKQAVELFIDSEGYEIVKSLRNELIGVKAGRFVPELLSQQFGSKGPQRLSVYGDFSKWAALMLQWMNFYKNRG